MTEGLVLPLLGGERVEISAGCLERLEKAFPEFNVIEEIKLMAVKMSGRGGYWAHDKWFCELLRWCNVKAGRMPRRYLYEPNPD